MERCHVQLREHTMINKSVILGMVQSLVPKDRI